MNWITYIWDQARISNGSLEQEGIPDTFDARGWITINIGQGEMPKQINGFDCGMFCIRTVEALANQCLLDFKQVFLSCLIFTLYAK